MPTFQLAIALRVVRTRLDMGHATVPDECLEIPGQELRPIIADDTWRNTWMFFQGCLADDLDIQLLHRITKFMMNDVPTVTIEHRNQKVERATDIDVRNVHVPVFVGRERLFESVSFGRRAETSTIKAAGGFQHSVNRRRTDRDDVVIEHHEAQTPIAFQGISVVIVHDRSPFPVLQPPVARDLPVVSIDFAIAAFPGVVLTGGKSDPEQQLDDWDFAALGPVLDVIDDLVSRIMGNPATFQSSPLSFFERIFSSISSEMTSFLAASFSRSAVSLSS